MFLDKHRIQFTLKKPWKRSNFFLPFYYSLTSLSFLFSRKENSWVPSYKLTIWRNISVEHDIVKHTKWTRPLRSSYQRVFFSTHWHCFISFQLVYWSSISFIGCSNHSHKTMPYVYPTHELLPKTQQSTMETEIKHTKVKKKNFHALKFLKSHDWYLTSTCLLVNLKQ